MQNCAMTPPNMTSPLLLQSAHFPLIAQISQAQVGMLVKDKGLDEP